MCAGAAPALLDAVGPVPAGGRLLDVGTGTGTVAGAAAARGWAATGSDGAESMLAIARREHQGVEFELGDVLALPNADDSFDAIVGNFSVNHTADPRRAVAELVRVAKPGAPIAFTTWGRPSALVPLWQRVIDESGAARVPVDRILAELDFQRSEAGLLALLADGGAEPVEVVEIEWEFAIAPEGLWAAAPAGVAVVGPIYRAADESTRAAMRTAYDRAASELVAEDDLLHVASSAWLAFGRAPRTAS
nr:class I SAM-dependent methyltransferase [Agromyces seonyuensis]